MASTLLPTARHRLTSKTLLLLVSVLLLRGAPGGRGNPIPQPLQRPRPPATATAGGWGSDRVEEPWPLEQGGDAAVQSLLENLKEQFLRTFNLSGPGGAGSRVEPPEYMMELYNRFANDHNAMPTANIIRSFKNEAPAPGDPEDSGIRRHPLLFNVSVPHHERITAAELRLYTLVQNDRHLYKGVDRRVTVYELGPADRATAAPLLPPARGDSPQAPPEPPEPLELASRQVYGVDDGWEAFDLTAAVQRWRRSESGTTHRLEVHIASLVPEEGRGPEVEVSRGNSTPAQGEDLKIDTSPEEKHKPLLIVFSNDQSGDDRQDRHELNEMIDHETSDLVLQRDNLELGLGSLWGDGQREEEDDDEEPDEEELLQMRSNMIYDTTSRIRRNAKGNYCKRQSLMVEFKDIGWDSWILAPTGYDAFECSGVCTYPLTKHVTPTKHAIVQTLININSPQKAAKACCVPTKLEPISLLYLDDTGVVTYKFKYEGMVVAECGCR